MPIANFHRDYLLLGILATSILGPVLIQEIRSKLKLVRRRRSGGALIKSPLEAVKSLSSVERDNLPYPPAALPGSRDVDSPYGSIRVYEWGQEDGRKVLLVHGISTPCIALASLAEGLVKNGCRVMLFGKPPYPSNCLYRVLCTSSTSIDRTLADRVRPVWPRLLFRS